MNNLDAYKDWKDIFNENVSNVWREESIPALKKLSMLLFSIKKEIKRIEDEINQDVTSLRNGVIEAQNKKQHILSMNQAMDLDHVIKENTLDKPRVSRLSQSMTPEIIAVDSPEMFQNLEPPLSGSYDSESIVISEDDHSKTVTSGSPEIKKKKRNIHSQKLSKKGQRLRKFNNTTLSFLDQLNKESGSVTSQNTQRQEGTIVDDSASLDFFKGLVRHSQKSGNTNNDATPKNVKSKMDIIELNGKDKELVLTPVRNDCDIDISLVQCTPVSISLPKRKEKISSFLSKKKTRLGKSTTLTQMFSRSKNINTTNSRLKETNYDSDETYFDPVLKSKTKDAKEISSNMGITRMISYLNSDSQANQNDDSKNENEKKTITNLNPDTQEIANFVDDIRLEDFEEDDNCLNSAIVEEDEEVEVNASEGLNEFLAKAQNVPDHQLEAAAVVRGKARQKLPGWTCKDCEKFYLKQGLTSSQILVLNKCSKHRGQYRPREDTLPGYWDMNIVTQETNNTE